jgi:hypothetical protein
MVNLQNYTNKSQTNYLTGIGHKVKHLAGIGMGIKHACDTAKTVYSIAQAAAPYVEAALPLLGIL